MILVSMQYDNLDPLVQFSDLGDGRYELDVRELMLDGGQPYSAIMGCIHELRPGETLELHAIFEPVPLIRKLQKQGFTAQAAHRGVDHWVVEIRTATT